MNTEYERGYVDGHKAGARLATQAALDVPRSEVVDAITDMQEGRESHQQWLDHLSNPEREDCKGCEDHATHVGDIDHHRQWIDKYDRVIRLLALVPIITTPTAGGESPILAFESWLLRWVADNGRKLTQTEYGIVYAAFIAAHPGDGPKAHVMSPAGGERCAEREFLEASVAVWRELDKREPYTSANALDSSTELRKREKAAWEHYKDQLDKCVFSVSPEAEKGQTR